MLTTRKRKRLSKEARYAILSYEFNRKWRGQTGGGVAEGNGVRYDYRTNMNNDTIVIYGGRKACKTECFLLFIEPDGRAVLQGLKQASDCALDPNGTGRSMLLAAVNLAKKKGAKTLELTDDSTKYMENGMKFSLADMYFLTSGRTWYETIIPSLRPLEDAETIEENRHKVLTNKWKDIITKMPPSVHIPVDISDINIDEEGSAIRVLDRIKRAQTDFFALYGNKLILASNILPLKGTTWITDLN